jgi:hypothetical protein
MHHGEYKVYQTKAKATNLLQINRQKTINKHITTINKP